MSEYSTSFLCFCLLAFFQRQVDKLQVNKLLPLLAFDLPPLFHYSILGPAATDPPDLKPARVPLRSCPPDLPLVFLEEERLLLPLPLLLLLLVLLPILAALAGGVP